MKKHTLIAAFLVIALVFAGCSAQKSSDITSDIAPSEANDGDRAPEFDATESGDGGYGYRGGEAGQESTNSNLIYSSVNTINSKDKIIYTANATIETIKFEESIDAVNALIEKHDAFIESSSVTGNDYVSEYYGNNFRRASFIIRVPKEAYDMMSGELSTLGHLTSFSTSAQNITSQFVDNESRLNTYKIEESRLLEMLEKADTVTDMISIETRLSEVRYNIESLTSKLNNWQHQVDYSTINLNIHEVRELTPEIEIHRTLGQEIKDAFNKSIKGLVKFFKNTLVVAIAALPILALPIIIVVVILLVLRARRKKRKINALLNHDGDYKQDNPDND